MKYAYEDLGSDGFEKLIVAISKKIFGIAAQGFASGPDGGRDARFLGTAQLFPSTSSPWVGKTIIQAKHTYGLNKSFSDPDFFNVNSQTCVINEEFPRILNLIAKKELDNYILFSNRRLTAGMESQIRKYVCEKTALNEEKIHFCGLESLEEFLREFPDIAEKVNLDPIDFPLKVSSQDLAEVVEALASNKGVLKATGIENPPRPRVPYEEKNRINKMTEEYANKLRRNYLKDTPEITAFLSAPQNNKLLKLYESIVEEFDFKIISKRKDYQTFDEVIEYLFDLLLNRDQVLSRNARLTRRVLFHMYWFCDIGLEEEKDNVKAK